MNWNKNKIKIHIAYRQFYDIIQLPYERKKIVAAIHTYRSAFPDSKTFTFKHKWSWREDETAGRSEWSKESVSFRKIDFCNLENKHPAMRRATTTTTMMMETRWESSKRQKSINLQFNSPSSSSSSSSVVVVAKKRKVENYFAKMEIVNSKRLKMLINK